MVEKRQVYNGTYEGQVKYGRLVLKTIKDVATELLDIPSIQKPLVNVRGSLRVIRFLKQSDIN